MASKKANLDLISQDQVLLFIPSTLFFCAPLSINLLFTSFSLLLLHMHQAKTDRPINQMLLSSIYLPFI
jgi:hypothetical protein